MVVGIFGRKKVELGRLCNLEVWKRGDREMRRFGDAKNDKLYAHINFSIYQPFNYH